LFFGLDLDIRHITFAAGNFALGFMEKIFRRFLYILDLLCNGFLNRVLQLSGKLQLIYVPGIQIKKDELGQVSEIYKEIFRYFVKHPLKFFLPLRSGLDKKQMT
jgi:site-specific recombinase